MERDRDQNEKDAVKDKSWKKIMKLIYKTMKLARMTSMMSMR